jgi:hypothetical protein
MAMWGFQSTFWVVFGVFSIALDSLPLHAREPEGRKPSRSSEFRGVVSNSTYLRTTRGLEGQNLRDLVFDHQMSCQMKQQFEDMTRQYEYRKLYKLTTVYEDQQHLENVSNFSRNAVDSFQNFHFQRGLQDAQGKLEKTEFAQTAKKPIGIMVGAAAIYTGRPMRFRALQSRFEARTDVRNRRGSLGVQSPWFHGGVEYADIAERGNVLDVTQTEERARWNIARGIPILDVNCGLSYGVTTQTATASLSKQLTPNLSAVVDSSRSRLNDRGQESVKLFYGVQF